MQISTRKTVDYTNIRHVKHSRDVLDD